MKKILITVIAAVILLITNCYAMQPAGQYFEDTGIVVIEGSCIGLEGERYVNLIAAECNNISDVNDNNIAYADSCLLDDDDSYNFRFLLKKNFEKCRFWIKTANVYEPIELIKVVTGGNDVMPEKSVITLTADTISIGARTKPKVEMVFENGNRTECSDYTLLTDDSCVKVADGFVYGISNGTAEIRASVTYNGENFISAPVHVDVKSKATDDYAQVVGITYKDGDNILNGGEIADADSIMLVFDSDMQNINVKDISGNDVKGSYNSDERTYMIRLDAPIGLNRYKFYIISDTEMVCNKVSIGMLTEFNASDVMIANKEYACSVALFDNNGDTIIPDEVYFNDVKTDTYIFTPKSAGMQLIEAEVIYKGYSKKILKEVDVCNVADIIPVTDKQLLKIGEKAKISVLAIGDNGKIIDAEDLEITYKTSRRAKVSVDGNGVLLGREMGTAVITVIYGDLEKEFTMGVEIAAEDSETGIYFDDTDVSVGIDGYMSCLLCRYYANGKKAPLDNVAYAVSDSRLAQIDENGILKACEEGTVEVTAVCDGRVYKKTVSIIKEDMPIIRISADSKTLIIGKTEKINVTSSTGIVIPHNRYTLYSSDTNIVKIENNIISAVNTGSCEIYAKAIVNGTEIVSPSVAVSVVEDGYSVIDDNFDDFDKMYEYDSRLQIFNNNLYTSGENQNNAYIVYNAEHVKKLILCAQIHETLGEKELICIYGSEDNENYTYIPCLYSRGKTVNGWKDIIVTSNGIPDGVKFIKIIMGNIDGNTQFVRLKNARIESYKPIEVISAEICDVINSNTHTAELTGRYMAVSFNRQINPDSLVNIKVNGRASAGIYDVDRYRYIIKLPDKSDNDCDILIDGISDIFDSLLKKDVNIRLNGVDDSFAIYDFTIKKMTGNVAKGKITLINNSMKHKNYEIVSAVYSDDGQLVGVHKQRAGSVLPMSEKSIDVSVETKKITKIFVWENEMSMIPVGTAITICE